MNNFSKLLNVEIPAPRRSNFDLSHPVQDTLSPGFLVPILVEDILPGDDIELSVTSRLKSQPTLAPILGKYDLTFFSFICPWKNYIPSMNFNNKLTKFEDEFVLPYYRMNSSSIIRVAPASLFESLGLPVGFSNISAINKNYTGDLSSRVYRFNAIPLLSYWDIWRNYFANPQSDDVFFSPGRFVSSSISDENFVSINVRFFDEFFNLFRSNSSGDFVTVVDQIISNYTSLFGTSTPVSSCHNIFLDMLTFAQYDSDVFNQLNSTASHNGFLPVMYHDDVFMSRLSSSYVDYVRQNVTVDTSSGSFSIDQLRMSNKLAKYVDKSIFGGTRYGQYLKSHFAVNGLEKLDIPILIGVDRMSLYFDDVVSQAQTGTGNNQDLGSVGGRASEVFPSTDKITYYSKEHATLMVLVALRPNSVYYQGISKNLMKLQFSDIYVPELDAVGWQPQLAGELYANTLDVQRVSGTSVGVADPSSWVNLNDIVGYTPAWVEYMTHPGRCRGMFATTLDYWTLQRKFGYRSGEDVVIDFSTYVNPDIFNYAFAGTTDDFDNFYLNTWFDLNIKRNISKQILPSL